MRISQLTESGYDVVFNQETYKTISQTDGSILLTG